MKKVSRPASFMWTATQLVRIRYSSFGVSGSTRRPLPIEMIDAFEPRAPF